MNWCFTAQSLNRCPLSFFHQVHVVQYVYSSVHPISTFALQSPIIIIVKFSTNSQVLYKKEYDRFQQWLKENHPESKYVYRWNYITGVISRSGRFFILKIHHPRYVKKRTEKKYFSDNTEGAKGQGIMDS
jgi:hypothetical protein